MNWVAVLAAVAIVVAIYVTWLTARLSRLHARVAAADRALEGARRARVLAACALMNVVARADAGADLRSAASAAQDAGGGERVRADNKLTRELVRYRASVAVRDDVWQGLADAHRRLVVARQLYNDAVRDTVALRGRRIPRALRLAAPYPRPEYFDINTELT